MVKAKRYLSVCVVLSLLMIPQTATASGVVSHLRAYDAIIRVPLPAGTAVEVESHDRVSGTQVFRISPALRPADRALVESTLRSTGRIRKLFWEGEQLTVGFTTTRAAVVDLGEGLWAAVLRRPLTFPGRYYLRLQECMAIFDALGVPQRRACEIGSAPNLIPSSPELQARLAPMKGAYAKSNAERVDRLLGLRTRLFFGDPNHPLLPSITVLAAVELVELGEYLHALRLLTPFVVQEVGELAQTFQRLATSLLVLLYETAIEEGTGTALVELFLEFDFFGVQMLASDAQLLIASKLIDSGRPRYAVDLLQVFLEEGEDRRAFTLLESAYEDLGQSYRAHAVRRFLSRTER